MSSHAEPQRPQLPGPQPISGQAPITQPTQILRQPLRPALRERPSRILLADDLSTWAEESSPGGLLRISSATRLARLEDLAGDGARLIMLCSEGAEAEVNRQMALARAALEVEITVVALPGGPLGQYAVARITEQALSVAGRPTSLVVSILPTLAAELVNVAVLHSVTGLDIPGVGVGHHLASLLPGQRQFAVQLTPHPLVRSVSKDLLAEGFTRATFGTIESRVLIAGPLALPPQLEVLTGVTDVPHRVRTELDLAGFWGDEEATEIVAVPKDPAAWIAQRVPVQPHSPCDWCGAALATSASRCVFCGYVVVSR
ncbi:hypothetical protein [Kineosporia babensis]|uniref:Uncharacterized protein n=1 Tax=Kineosporia babensis TaxID=499548 RepID=A0A9X1N8X9_9ACTN|nr:hypothetical protein [Kineosporia babensis]MCD5309743.1 hypothetical protein [Kineosporia babensis]